MTSEPEFPVAGATVWEQAVNLSGVLAEFGSGKLEVLTTEGTCLRLTAGQTDLPALLSGGSVGHLSCESLGLRVRIKGGLLASCTRIEIRRRLQQPA